MIPAEVGWPAHRAPPRTGHGTATLQTASLPDSKSSLKSDPPAQNSPCTSLSPQEKRNFDDLPRFLKPAADTSGHLQSGKLVREHHQLTIHRDADHGGGSCLPRQYRPAFVSSPDRRVLATCTGAAVGLSGLSLTTHHKQPGGMKWAAASS